MKPVLQTEHIYPNGNCFAACMASIMELPEIPELGEDWFDDAIEAAHVAGWQLIWLDCWRGTKSGPRSRSEIYQPFSPPGHHIASGYTGTADTGSRHSCVALDGEIVHDPHPNKPGIARIDNWMLCIPHAR